MVINEVKTLIQKIGNLTQRVHIGVGNDQELVQSDTKLRPQYFMGKKSQHEVMRKMKNRVSCPFSK